MATFDEILAVESGGDAPCLRLRDSVEIFFAHHSFKWSNNAARNAGVIVGIARTRERRKTINYGSLSRIVSDITAYLVEGKNLYVKSVPAPLQKILPSMLTGSIPNDDGNPILSQEEAHRLTEKYELATRYLHPYFGSQDFLHGYTRNSLVIGDDQVDTARAIPEIDFRLYEVARHRNTSKKKETREQLSLFPNRFQYRGTIPSSHVIVVLSVSSERREWFPAGVLPQGTVISNLAFMIVDASLWNMALIPSRLHLVWIGTVCGELKTDFRYSNALGWNTFPVPTLTTKNRDDLTACAENILLAREAHFPATVAKLYDPEKMPENLRAAHERNDEVLERIYIGRCFKNDTERLEILFELYSQITEVEKKTSTAIA
ncbi:MAG: hypothetical protein OYH76_20090 [Defluviicoccus sp.]|nr:hypothetical protein [Defluviicoccus sp.]MDE0278204.1 hypothetical protein [Defluviicoccus sp.]